MSGAPRRSPRIRLRPLPLWLAAGLGLSWALSSFADSRNASYVIVVSERTRSDPEWKRVVLELEAKHQARIIAFKSSAEEVLPELRQVFPRYVCFVAKPEEATRQFVTQAHRITRRLDDDPYTDCFWGILTGYNSQNALRIARLRPPLAIHKAGAGTSVPLELCEEGLWYSELRRNEFFRKRPGETVRRQQGPDDTTRSLVELLNDYGAELFVTSGHATERDWQIGYSYRGGSFRCEDGRLFGFDTSRQRYPIESPNPKVYLAVGNCLMGHIDGANAMALAFMNSAGVAQMVGYTVNTWYGYAGWGCLDYFLEQPGRYTLNEAYVANDHALIHRLQNYFPGLLEAEIDDRGRTSANLKPNDTAQSARLTQQDGRGLLYDRDVLAFYGDPAWEARMAAMQSGWEQTLTREKDRWTLEVKPRRGAGSFQVLDSNGSQRGGRPVIQFLPCRIKQAKVIEGADLNPVITDDFILIPLPQKCDPGRIYRTTFDAGAL